MRFFVKALAVVCAAAATGCYASVGVVGTIDSETDTTPDTPPDTAAEPGIDPVHDPATDDHPPLYCVDDSQCAILDPIDCCNGCPVVAPRSAISSYPCRYERGTAPPDPIPVECMMDCYACPDCFPQPIAASCDSGTCVASIEGCQYPSDPDPPVASAARIAADPVAFAGGMYTMSGSTISRWPVCDDFCSGTAPCCDAALYLDGVVRLGGWPCDAYLGCTSDVDCPFAWDCGHFEEGASYEVKGEISAPSAHEPPLVMVMGIREIPPPGIGGAYLATVTSAWRWSDDPGVECEETVSVGDSGRMVLADAEGDFVLTNDLFDEFWTCSEYWGSRTGSTFEARIPIMCDDCCCDFSIDASVDGMGMIEGAYRSFDGICHTEAAFSGTRE